MWLERMKTFLKMCFLTLQLEVISVKRKGGHTGKNPVGVALGGWLKSESNREQEGHIKRSGGGSWEAQLTEACSKELRTRQRGCCNEVKSERFEEGDLGSLLGANCLMLMDEEKKGNAATVISAYSIQENHHCTEKDRMIPDDKELRSKTEV